jgi:hypothetical protein
MLIVSSRVVVVSIRRTCRSPGCSRAVAVATLVIGSASLSSARSSPWRGGSIGVTAIIAVTTSPGRLTASRTALPRLKITLSIFIASATPIASISIFDGSSRSTALATHFVEECVQLRLSATNATLVAATTVIVAPVGPTLTLRTITGHMTRLSTSTTDDACGEVLLLRTVVLPVANLAAVLTSLVLIVTKGSVEGGKLAELITLKFVLAFRNRSSLDIVS